MRFQRQVLVAVLAACSLGLVAGSAAAGGLATSSTSSLLAAINTTRAAHGLAPVRLDTRLGRAARAHSTDMLSRGYFAHGAFGARMRASGAAGPAFGEDLAWGAGVQVRTRSFVARWLASPRHRAVLLHAGFRRIGIGLVTGRFAGHSRATVVTADFAGS
jgi:uncharacterized protein YkwD